MSTTLFTKQVICPACGIKFPCRTNYQDKKFEEISSHQDAVNRFMKLGEQELPSKPIIPSLEIRKLRARLILEEAIETINALGFEIWYDFTLKQHDDWVDLKEIIDGCCDLRVVTTGTLSACGVKDIRPQELVDDNNLNKFHWSDHQIATYFDNPINKGARWTRREIDGEVFTIVWNKDGKVIKPPGHKLPAIEEEINRQSKLH